LQPSVDNNIKYHVTIKLRHILLVGTRKGRSEHAQNGDNLAARRLQPLAGCVAAGRRGAAVSLGADDIRHLAAQTAALHSQSFCIVVFDGASLEHRAAWARA
jgi:hypothetical protein